MTKNSWMDEERLNVPSMFISEDSGDEIEMVDTGKVDADGQPIIIALSHKQGFAGFIPPGEYARIQRRKAEAEAKQELSELVESIIVSTLTKLGLTVDAEKLKAKPKGKAKGKAK
ncbi:hypothetical protein [Mesorhizobium sp. M8A.F.Ca.ET.021.01.1.1]|uniref:hypothetical protein n=1 Tax=Mesorhizobium sp. M8A.F.Ca.ET.021.01.1.1 TaxID=2496757 RepID=UPI000FCBB7AF|nr:hypothetical protein [Mesorhizobium sp. M8A.F.Ca.ET.021.01.1.1]RUW56852.1 hypothetical protein EOA36_02315 [Mesorhizobium sp. M8A.F.Ca.ET.021.01.1.1]